MIAWSSKRAGAVAAPGGFVAIKKTLGRTGWVDVVAQGKHAAWRSVENLRGRLRWCRAARRNISGADKRRIWHWRPAASVRDCDGDFNSIDRQGFVLCADTDRLNAHSHRWP